MGSMWHIETPGLSFVKFISENWTLLTFLIFFLLNTPFMQKSLSPETVSEPSLHLGSPRPCF